MGALSKFGFLLVLVVFLAALGLGGAMAQGGGGEDDGGDTQFAISAGRHPGDG